MSDGLVYAGHAGGVRCGRMIPDQIAEVYTSCLDVLMYFYNVKCRFLSHSGGASTN